MKYAGVKRGTRQAGVAAIEFAGVVLVFLMIIFGMLELARVEYLMNTLTEVTRRAAAKATNVNFNDGDALKNIQADAVFRATAGPLVLGDPVTADNVKIDYLSVQEGTLELKHITALPACPARSHWNCMNDRNGDSCIRFVRARICESMDGAGNCQPMSYQAVFPFLDLSAWRIPIAETIVPAGSLGNNIGTLPCF